MTSRGLVLLFTVLPLFYCTAHGYKYRPKQARCERITIPLCSDMRYNYTRMPNLLGHVTQQEAAAQVHEFIPLVQVGCSRLLQFFLCAEYAPMCTEQVDEILVIPPCRAMCVEVRSRCEPVLLRFNFHWPPALDCDALPERSTRQDLCIEPPGHDDKFPHDSIDLELTLDQQDSAAGAGAGRQDWMKLMEGLGDDDTLDHGLSSTPQLALHCPRRFAPAAAGNDVTCLPRCLGDVIFRAEDKAFAATWQLVWAGLSLTSSVITVMTFLLDTTRLRYPERPVVYVSICSALYAGAYIVRACVGRDVIACDHVTAGQHLVRSNVNNLWCSVVAAILHYSSIAGASWWTVLTVSWYLAAARKWGEEAISSMSRYFHAVCWSVPTITTTVALALHRVSADELTGLCFIGAPTSGSASGLVEFIVVPLVAALVIGTCFVAAGFGSVYRIRRAVRREGGSVERLERLMVKMAVFSVLYALPLTCTFACLLYEHRGTEHWNQLAQDTPCSRHNGLTQAREDCALEESIPAVEVYLVKTFMCLMPGIASGVWIWSMKTVQSWKRRLVDCDCSRSHGVKDQRWSGRPVGGGSSGGRLVRWTAGLSSSRPSHRPTQRPFTLTTSST